MATVNLDLVAERLFAAEGIAARIRRDYGIEPGSVGAMTAGLLRSIAGHLLRSDARDDEVTNGDVFHAATLALASNSRSWVSVLRNEARLAGLLHEYDPVATATAVRAGELAVAQVAALLPGQTSSADARAIARWADRLATDVPYYQALLGVRSSLVARGLRPEEIAPAVALLLGGASAGLVRQFTLPAGFESWKAPGMGAVLAVEFLRNLRWSGFKPDRHIRRLFDRWFPDVVRQVSPRAHALADDLGSRSQVVIGFLTYSLVGAAVTPPGRSWSETDCLVWALGAYVEKRGRESDTRYRLE